METAAQVRLEIALTVVGAVAAVVTTIATAGTAGAVATLAGLATAAVGATEGLIDSVEMIPDSYESIMESLETQSGELASVILTQEAAVRDMVNGAIGIIEGDAATFDLDAYTIKDFDSTSELITITEDDAEVVTDNMSRIQTALASASLGSAPSSSFLRRDDAVGLGETGPYTQIVAFHDRLSSTLLSTTTEYGRGIDLFRADVDDHFGAEADATSVAEALEAEMQPEGSVS